MSRFLIYLRRIKIILLATLSIGRRCFSLLLQLSQKLAQHSARTVYIGSTSKVRGLRSGGKGHNVNAVTGLCDEVQLGLIGITQLPLHL